MTFKWVICHHFNKGHENQSSLIDCRNEWANKSKVIGPLYIFSISKNIWHCFDNHAGWLCWKHITYSAFNILFDHNKTDYIPKWSTKNMRTHSGRACGSSNLKLIHFYMAYKYSLWTPHNSKPSETPAQPQPFMIIPINLSY